MQIVVNTRPTDCKTGQNLLQVLKEQGLNLPSLCSLPNLKNIGVCRLCMVEIGEERSIKQACLVEVENQMIVYTDSIKLRELRKVLMEMILQEHGTWHQKDCEICALGTKLGAVFEIRSQVNQKLILNDYLAWDENSCIHCDRCIRSCNRSNTLSRPKPRQSIIMKSDNCNGCGDCIRACPAQSMVLNIHE